MDLFEFKRTEADEAELEAIRSQNNVARATLHFRLENGLTQAELARLAQTTQARVSEVEALKGDPKLSTLSRVAQVLGCMIDMVPVPVAAPLPTPQGFDPVGSRDVSATAGSPSDARTDLSIMSPTSSRRLAYG